MDPLAVAAAALVAKAALEAGGKKVGESAWSVLNGVAGWIGDRFGADGDDAGQEVLTKVEEAPDSPSRVQALAEHLDGRLKQDSGSAEFRSGLVAQVEQAGAVGGEVGAFVVNVRDQATVGKIVQIGVVHTDKFQV